MMQIIGSVASPYVRYIRILLEELSLPYEFKKIANFSDISAEELLLINRNNPAMKIPILIDGDQRVFDSRVIANYLLEKSGSQTTLQKPKTIDDENLITTLYAAMDAGIYRLASHGDGMDLDTPYMKRSLKRIEKCLKFLDNQMNPKGAFTIQTALLISMIDWFEFRNIFDTKSYANLMQIHVHYKDRPSIAGTSIDNS